MERSYQQPQLLLSRIRDEPMPLNDVARQYADRLFQNALEEALQWQQQQLSAVVADHTRRNMMQSGSYLSARINVTIRFFERLGQVRVESLLKAYDRQGLPFDDTTLAEITTEVNQFCHSQQHNAVSALGPSIKQTFGDPAPSNLREALVEQIMNGVTAIMSRLTRDLRIKRDEVILDEIRTRKAYAAGLGKRWDVFICHATEDKDNFVRPLATALQATGLIVWYDEFSLSVGDSLRRTIDEGITNSRYGIVVLSHSFFAKNWPQHELDGLMSKEAGGTKVILPIWHSITADELRQYSAMLSGLVAANSNEGMDAVVRKLREAMGL